ncbi:aspartate carbamoyltransferase catalytic subunit [Reichenbachiella agariperforans]|uniref:Aspartate carbamoyltransferase catalytic subunit n=1 Tax=Reichenbachiella agariperforans TaxID=156994 RepID=A0A1M6J800_REIAG|nr:aspartate carbamoyltransferase [Reichenbachiella agariperforans]SHJ42792.1 aspartate carbamoyltransferase catalytic subunit [Reichenbachiella agariperforans]
MVSDKFDPGKNALDKNPLASDGLNPDPEKLLQEDPINIEVLKRLTGQSILSVNQFDKELVLEICKFAALLESTEIAKSHPLDGKIIVTAFFEASTRTRLSFESAVLRLDGKIISISDGKSTGQAKGESLLDIGEMFNAYGDCVVMRHTETSAIEEIMPNLRVPLINAGNGSGEHPTQSLADWFAILKWKPQLKGVLKPEEKIHLGILGTPGSMRAVNSFLRMSLLFKDDIKQISIISEMADPLGEELNVKAEASGIKIHITNDINEVVEDLDVIYMNSIAFLGDSYKSLDSRFKLDENTKLKEDAVVLHPLARLDELDPILDDTHHNLYFTQAHGAVFIRQALFISVLNRFNKLPKDKIPTA